MPSHKTKTSASLAMWQGFSNEFRKIAMATAVTNKVTMAKKMPGYARLNREPDPPSPVNQVVPSVPPPPVSVSTFP